MPEYYNPWSHTVELIGPTGDRIRIKGKSTKTLDDYFDKYVERGYIQKTSTLKQDKPSVTDQIVKINTQASINVNRIGNNKHKLARNRLDNTSIRKTIQLSQPKQMEEVVPLKTNTPSQSRQIVKQILPTSKGLVNKSSVLPQQHRNVKPSTNKIVGKEISGNALNIYNNSILPYRISNGVAICVLSYNRHASLRRLIESIKATIDLEQVVIFVSDDASTDLNTIAYLNELANDLKIVVIMNNVNIGVAGNTNRLLRCAQRFEHIFIVNDDVEFLKPGWDKFYINKSKQSFIHHACFRQSGVYGAKNIDVKCINLRGVNVELINSKPHGAMLYLNNKVLKTCGFFDESYKNYGMEHVDWSLKPAEFGLQPVGFFDFTGSIEYITIHSESSAVNDRNQSYKINKELFSIRKEKFKAEPTNESKVPKITYLIPCRDFERTDSIKTVINGVIGQSFPEIEIILIEQDVVQRINQNTLPPIDYLFVDDTNRGLFNKSKAFNKGAAKATSEYLVLHDADMLSRVDYTKTLYNLLNTHAAVHICGKVLYLNSDTTNVVNKTGKIPNNPTFERMIGYFEGGSLAIKKSSFWNVGAFNEDYNGYGCFVPGNKVITNRGLVNIEDVRKCDELLTHNGNYKKQISRIRNYNGVVLDIFVPGRLPIKGVTPNHPFLVHDINGEYVWREARDLRKGDLLAQTDVLPDLSPTVIFQNIIDSDKCESNSTDKSQFGMIYDIREYKYDGLVYNFEVEDDHSYYVHGISVHNCEDCDFYTRVKSLSTWLCTEEYDLIHLWHTRVQNWSIHHNENKRLEAKLSLLPVEKRIELQLKQLKSLGYIN